MPLSFQTPDFSFDLTPNITGVDPIPTTKWWSQTLEDIINPGASNAVIPDAAVPVNAILDDGTMGNLLKPKNFIEDVVGVNYPANILIKRTKITDNTNTPVWTFPFRTNKFIIQGISKSRMERFQIVETFGLPSFFFFDERTKIYVIQGVLMDAFFGRADSDPFDVGSEIAQQGNNNKYQWAQAFEQFYENELRATRLVVNNSTAILAVNNFLLECYPVQLNIQKESVQLDNAVRFDLTIIVINETLMARDKGIDNLYKLNLSDTTEQFQNTLFKILKDLHKLDADYQSVPLKGLNEADQLKERKRILKEQIELRQKYFATISVASGAPKVISPDVRFIRPQIRSEWD